MTHYLSTEDLWLAAQIVTEPEQPLVRDAGALAAAAARPATTVFGQDAYPTLADKVAAILHSIVRNHPLVDGNKRLGWLAAVGTCRINGHDLEIVNVEEAEAFVLGVATGEIDVSEASKVISDNMHAM